MAITTLMEIRGKRLRVTWEPNAHKEKTWARMRQAVTDPGLIMSCVSIWSPFICETVIAWDLSGDDGRPVPLESRALGDLPRRFLLEVVTRMVEEWHHLQDTKPPPY
jgi:hypothetical protein